MVHCIYERVIKLKRNFKKLYIVFCRYCCCLHIRICCSKPLKGLLAFAVITSTFATVTGFLWLPDQSRHGLLQYLMFGTERHYICPLRYHLGLRVKKFTENVVTLTTQKSPLGVSFSLSHTQIGLPGRFHFHFPTSNPDTFTWEFPAGGLIWSSYYR